MFVNEVTVQRLVLFTNNKNKGLFFVKRYVIFVVEIYCHVKVNGTLFSCKPFDEYKRYFTKYIYPSHITNKVNCSICSV